MIMTPLEKQGGLRRIDQESKYFGELIERIQLGRCPNQKQSLYLEQQEGEGASGLQFI
jgi:hypothetical protein